MVFTERGATYRCTYFSFSPESQPQYCPIAILRCVCERERESESEKKS